VGIGEQFNAFLLPNRSGRLKRKGLEWTGLERIGVERTGTERIGLERKGLDFKRNGGNEK